jgi:hypothetical protein
VIFATQVLHAFKTDQARAVLGRVERYDDGVAVIRGRDGGEIEVRPWPADKFADRLARASLTLLDDLPLVLVHQEYRVLALAFGPSATPDRLEVNTGVVRLQDGNAVEMPGADPQPSWYLFELVEGDKQPT